MSETSQPTRRYRRRQLNEEQQPADRPLLGEGLVSGGSAAPSASLDDDHGGNDKKPSEPEERPLLDDKKETEVEMSNRKSRFRRDRQDNKDNKDNKDNNDRNSKVPPVTNNKPVVAERRTLNQQTSEIKEVFSPPVVNFPLSLVNRTLWFNIGYRMEQYQRLQGLNKLRLYSKEASEGYVVGFNVMSIPDCCAEIMQMVRPYVRIHVVNINSGMYVKSVRKYAAKTVSTWSFLLNDPQSFPVWNQELVIDTNYEDVVHEDTLILFEVLDQKPSLHVKRDTKAAAKRVAWGFLLPISTNNKTINFGINNEWVKGYGNTLQGGTTAGTGNVDDGTIPTHDNYSNCNNDKLLHIQLYSFKHNENFIDNLQRQAMNWTKGDKYSSGTTRDDPSYPDGIPEVYIQWRRQQRSIIKGCVLKLAVGPRESSDNVHNVAIGETVITGNVISSPQRGIAMAPTDDMSKDINKVRSSILKRSRIGKESCVVPDRLLHRLEVGPEGAMVVSFSHIGHLLAVGSKSTTLTPPFSDQVSLISNPNIIYGLHLFDVDFGTEVWFESTAHHGVIYDIKWSDDDCHLLTCSGDGTVKVWDVSSLNSCSKTNADGSLPSPRGVSLMQQLYLHSQQMQQEGKVSGALLVQSLTTTPPLFIYCAVFQEYGISSADSSSRSATLPRIISGASDGRLRVYNNGSHMGNIRIGEDSDDFPPHEGNVNAITIDQRSKYLITSDSAGEIFVWRLDSRGWYQLLRKLKRDIEYGETSPRSKSISSGHYPGVSGVISLKMHPDKFKGQLLAYTMPSSLKVYSMSTYRCVSTCSGAGINGVSSVFSRAEISADGYYTVCGGSSKFNKHTYSLRFWESATGHSVPSALSDIEFPYPIRSVAWHPRQHMLAVSMVGQGAAVVIYCTERDSSDKVLSKKVNAAIVEIANLKKDKEMASTTESGKENVEQRNEAKA